MQDLNDILNQEEVFWFQKSRRTWIQEGDRNTNYYHRSTVIRRNRGRVQALKIEGEWVSDPIILANHVNNHFSQLFGRVDREVHPTDGAWRGHTIDRRAASRLERAATMEQVRRVVFGMKRFGSSGPDGIQASFY